MGLRTIHGQSARGKSWLILYCVKKTLILLRSPVSESGDYKADGGSGFHGFLRYYTRSPIVERYPPSSKHFMAPPLRLLERDNAPFG